MDERIKDTINRFIGAEFQRECSDGVCLDLGCGDNKHEGCIGVDRVDFDCVDYVCDFDSESLPFDEGYADEVFLISVLEHLEDWMLFLEEVHRVCKDGAIVHIQVPHYRHKDAFTDPQHKHFFTEDTFDHLLNHKYHDFDGNFQIVRKKKHRNIWLRVDAVMVDLKAIK